MLEPRGAREGVLHQSLLRVEAQLRAAMPGMPFHMPKPLSEYTQDKISMKKDQTHRLAVQHSAQHVMSHLWRKLKLHLHNVGVAMTLVHSL